MNFIQDEIEEVAHSLHLDVTLVPTSEAQQLREQVLVKFTNGHGSTFLWEDLLGDVSIQDADGRLWIGELVGGAPAIMFFNVYQDPAMFLFADGTQIQPLIAECTRFEFYLTGLSTNYLLASNHHNFVIAAGDAVEWLRRRETDTA